MEKSEIEKVLKQRFFVSPTGYPSQNGFLDYGPVLTQIKQQILIEFRKIFLEENVYEIEPSAVLPYNVLKNSGHIDKFCDIIISDDTNIYRADHFLEEKIGGIIKFPKITDFDNIQILYEKLQECKNNLFKSKKDQKNSQTMITEQFKQEDVDEILNNFDVVSKSPGDCTKEEIDLIIFLNNLHSDLNQKFTPAKDFNLIFKINDSQFLRPELAQSQFTNFKKLYEINNEKLPFSSMCIGRSYRNEISARGGMLRTKEFEQAEVEYFSENGSHSSFDHVKHKSVLILPRNESIAFETTLEDAFNRKLISSQAICYYMACAMKLCSEIGIKLDRIRFRQHNENEMAHYSKDCWDLEINTLSGWVECAGIADRSNYDLTVHSKDINTLAKRAISPKTIYILQFNKSVIAKKLKSRLAAFETFINNIDQEFIIKSQKNQKLIVNFEGEDFELSVTSKRVETETFIPSVTEPSFGISRILYALVEMSFNKRDDRTVLSLKPKMCYKHVIVTPLIIDPEFDSMIKVLKKNFKENHIRYQITERNCSIGRRYSSFDEIGVPFFITFDSQSLSDHSATIRDRDTTNQIRIPVNEITETLKDLIEEKATFASLLTKYI